MILKREIKEENNRLIYISVNALIATIAGGDRRTITHSLLNLLHLAQGRFLRSKKHTLRTIQVNPAAIVPGS